MLVVLIFINIAFAQTQLNCLQLENVNIGCVPSIDHSCFRNVRVESKDGKCIYVNDPATSLRVEGPYAFQCKSSKSTTTCYDDAGNPDTKGSHCTVSSECTEYYDPMCDEVCIPCFNTVKWVYNGDTKGCIVCTRDRCPDEPPVATVCAPEYQGMPLGPDIQCSTAQHCPEKGIDPLGKEHPMVIHKSPNCNAPELPKVQPTPVPQYCPWKVDKRSATGCEPIDPDNRNP